MGRVRRFAAQLRELRGFTRPLAGSGRSFVTGMLKLRRAGWLVLALVVLELGRMPLAQGVAIKLATVVPDGSIWDKNLKQMAGEWKQATSDRVQVTVFSGGSQGDEPTVLRKIRLDALQGASLTVVGLANIDGAFNVFNMPFFFESYDELNAVVEKLTPVLKQRVDAKGFVLLNWGHGGWLQVFSKRPVRTVADLKGLKLWTTAGDDRMTQWYKANGFQPRAMAMTDVLTGLTTGMIDALPSPPLAAMAFQWNRQAPYMLDIGLAPVVGATVIAKRTWMRISEADRLKLQQSALEVEKRLQADVPGQDRFAIGLMQSQGLTLTKAEGPEWKTEAETLARTMRGEMVPQDIFDLTLKERDAFRQRKAAGVAR
jgi:TRAP-type transport system periplasmic protein